MWHPHQNALVLHTLKTNVKVYEIQSSYSHPAYMALIQSRWRWPRFSWCLTCSHGSSCGREMWNRHDILTLFLYLNTDICWKHLSNQSWILKVNSFSTSLHCLFTHCPPSGRSRPMILSWGCKTDVYAAKLAGEPEYGWTFTPHRLESRPKVLSARFWQSNSIWSTISAPP